MFGFKIIRESKYEKEKLEEFVVLMNKMDITARDLFRRLQIIKNTYDMYEIVDMINWLLNFKDLYMDNMFASPISIVSYSNLINELKKSYAAFISRFNDLTKLKDSADKHNRDNIDFEADSEDVLAEIMRVKITEKELEKAQSDMEKALRQCSCCTRDLISAISYDVYRTNHENEMIYDLHHKTKEAVNLKDDNEYKLLGIYAAKNFHQETQESIKIKSNPVKDKHIKNIRK